MDSRIARAASAALLSLFFFASCSAAENGAKKLASDDFRIAKADGSSCTIKAEIAATDADRSRGLMFRKSVSDGEGMLFVFDSDRKMSFWMKNTYVPLSIAFISHDGRILEIRDMEPLSLAPVDSERSVRYALEAPRGWFARVGVAPGDKLDIPERYRSAK